MSKKVQSVFLVLVMLSAIALMIFFGQRYRVDRQQLSELTADLKESTARWNAINDQKVELQKELKAVKEELREAELTLEESEEKTAEITQDIQTLESEIQQLKQKLK